jgi:predicted neutral ceramidase superfamily lipid hydrolase
MLVAVMVLWLVFTLIFAREFLNISIILFIALSMALLVGIPMKWYNKQLLMAFLQIPGAIISMLKAVLKIGKARKQFIHTPHGESEH